MHANESIWPNKQMVCFSKFWLFSGPHNASPSSFIHNPRVLPQAIYSKLANICSRSFGLLFQKLVSECIGAAGLKMLAFWIGVVLDKRQDYFVCVKAKFPKTELCFQRGTISFENSIYQKRKHLVQGFGKKGNLLWSAQISDKKRCPSEQRMHFRYY